MLADYQLGAVERQCCLQAAVPGAGELCAAGC